MKLLIYSKLTYLYKMYGYIKYYLYAHCYQTTEKRLILNITYGQYMWLLVITIIIIDYYLESIEFNYIILFRLSY